ncbi:MAG: type I-C CRISPR-associated endonuclease Cas1c, partial [Candidatus Binataceae bacterium]
MELLNTLYITEPHAYLHLDHGTVRVEIDHATVLTVPLIQLEAIVCFGDVMWSPALVGECAREGRSMVLLQSSGRFRARIEGPVSGNVWLRQAQFEVVQDGARSLEVAKCIVAGKLRNCRCVLARALREKDQKQDARLAVAIAAHDEALREVAGAATLDVLRGVEGHAAKMYFAVLDRLVTSERAAFRMTMRVRRPPIDPLNTLLSFVYTLLTHECAAALETVGLDPQVGFLHTLRPGRPALALDLMEELRAVLADRLALSVINLRQIRPGDFEAEESGIGMRLSAAARTTVIRAYQERKRGEVHHRVLERRVPIGLIPQVQARLLAR